MNSNNGIFSTFGRFLIQLNAMKVKFLFYGIILWGSFVRAQIDSGNRTLGLPSTVSPPSGFSGKSSIIIPPAEKPLNPKYRTGAHNYLSDQPKDLGFIQNNNFVNPGEKIKKEINRKINEGDNADMTLFTRNQHFGHIVTTFPDIVFKYRDYATIDGDYANIIINGKVYKSGLFLASEWREVVIYLNEGFNQIEFEAVNMGQYVPNTAEFQIFDATGSLMQPEFWELATGFKATIIVEKK